MRRTRGTCMPTNGALGNARPGDGADQGPEGGGVHHVGTRAPSNPIGRSEVPTQRDRPTQSDSMHVSLRRALRRFLCLTETEIRLTAHLTETTLGWSVPLGWYLRPSYS